MPYVLIINAAVSLIMGLALVLVWRRDPTQTFTRDIGWANLVQLLAPVCYSLATQTNSAISALGFVGFPVAHASYSTLLIMGASHLTGSPISSKTAWRVFAVLIVVSACTLGFGGMRMGQGSMATINTMIGVMCTYRLWLMAKRKFTTETPVGLLLISLGLIQFIYVFYKEDGVLLLATLGAILRMCLGLVLIYAALDRGANATRILQRRFERLTERSHQGILISIGERDVVYANPACLAIYGVNSLEELRTSTITRTIPKAERAYVKEVLQQIKQGTQIDATYEAQRYRADGSPLWLHFHYFATEWDGEPALQVLISNETENHNASLALAHQALHDKLTGLPNRVAMIESLRDRCTSDRSNPGFVLLLMNLDRFKLFNEAHGHSMGDEVLKEMGRALRAAMDSSCEVMRLAGDEFAILSAPNCSGETAVAMVSTVRQLLLTPFQVSGQPLFIDASMGIALYPDSARDSESLLRAANAAMNVAKNTPGTSFRLAEKAFERGSSNALEQEQALRAAIEQSEIFLVYQPKVDAHTGLLTSFEALARWNRPGVGSVSPVDFIAAAERTGLIGALGTALLKQACQQIAVWLAHYGSCVPVAVNVSPLQMLDPKFPELVSNIMESTGVTPQLLTLEITESSAVQNMDQTVTQVAQLRAMGVHVAMDDFGTGFSSLNMLRTLRLHTVKIDRGLIEPLPSQEAIAVVRAICQLAEALQLHVVAEGVETSQQAIAARDAGCGELQGYLYSKPLAAQDAGVWLAQWQALSPTATGRLP